MENQNPTPSSPFGNSAKTINTLHEVTSKAVCEIKSLKSPHELHKQVMEEIIAGLDRAYQDFSTPSTTDDSERIQRAKERLNAYSDRLTNARSPENQPGDREEKLYKEQREEILQKLLLEIVEVVGKERVKAVLQGSAEEEQDQLQARPQRQPQSQSQPRPQPQPDPEHFESPDVQARLRSRIGHRPDYVVTSTDGSENEVVDISTTKRRKSTQNQGDIAAKRARTTTTQALSAPRQITFEEVFQGGNAKTKHEIVRYPKNTGEWYIVVCNVKSHNKDTFKQYPLFKACRHLGKDDHAGYIGNSDDVIRMLGVEVVDCTEELAEKNNRVALASWGLREKGSAARASRGNTTMISHEKPESATAPPNARTRPSSGYVIVHRTRGAEPITHPQTGHIYLCYWDRNPFGVLVLPINDLSSVGIPHDVQWTGLTLTLPTCYHFNEETGLYDWSSGYEDGGPFMNNRSYPVMWFNEPTFPGNFSWIMNQQLTHFEKDSAKLLGVTNIHLKQIQQYQDKVQKDAGGGQDSQQNKPERLWVTFRTRKLKKVTSDPDRERVCISD